VNDELDVIQTLEQVVTLLVHGERDAAAALIDGVTCDASVLVLAGAPRLFGQYLADGDLERAGCVASLAIAARDRLEASA